MHEILDDFQEKNLVDPKNISINFLYYPSYFRCNNFTAVLGKQRDDAVNKIKNEEIRLKVKRFLSENLDAEEDFTVFIEKVEEKDRIRNEDFKEFYPELRCLKK